MDIKFNVAIDGCLKSFTCDSCETEIDEFVIPAKVDGKGVSSIGRLGTSFSKLKEQGVKKIKRVIIEEGVKEIKNWAFANIKIEIDELHWTSDCEKIPEECFNGTPLKEIKGIERVKKIGASAFSYSDLKTITWPASCEKIPEECFNGTPLKEIKGIEHVKKIGESAFSRTNLKTITWPASCEKIPEECFNGTPLEEITGIEHVKEIGEYAFARTNLKTITWPVNCEEISTGCFCDSTIEAITFPSGGIRDIDLFDLAFSNVDIKKIDLSALGIVNFIKDYPGVDYQKLYDEMKEILRLPYYVTELE